MIGKRLAASLRTLKAVGWGACLAAGAVPASAALVNQYTFNDGTANDSVGGRHGTIVDPQGIVGFVGGSVDLRGNNAFNSNQDFSLPTAQGAYVDLPNGVFTDAVKGGTFLDATLEIWFTEEVHRN